MAGSFSMLLAALVIVVLQQSVYPPFDRNTCIVPTIPVIGDYRRNLIPVLSHVRFINICAMLNALVIDDEIDIWFLLSGMLRRHNLKTTFVNNLHGATKKLAKESPSVIFLDNRLPDGLGIDFICDIKKQRPLSKIVLITGHATDEDRRKALKNGADLFISKPFSSRMIDEALNKLMQY
jgi:two-component system, OmpR family, response regulator